MGTEARGARLPSPVSRFVGRAAELKTLGRVLTESRLVTVAGPGGVGKTRVALEAAQEAVGRYRDGVRFCDLSARTDGEGVARAIAAELGVKDDASSSLLDGLVRRLRNKELLLVLDNCEHVVSQVAALVDAVLREAPGLVVLATSRESLRVDGETVWRLSGMTLADDPDSPERIGESDAVQLFIDRAYRVTSEIELLPDQPKTIASICRHLDGLPLAIELAAARVHTLGLVAIERAVREGRGVLGSGPRTAAPRHRTLRECIAWSYDLLPEAEALLFARLSVFSGGFTLAAAEEVCGGEGLHATPVLDALSNLIDASLVVVEGRVGTRFRMLETIRQFAADVLASGEGSVDRQRELHLTYFARRVQRGHREVEASDRQELFAEVDADLDNIRGALEFSLSSPERTEVGLRLASMLPVFWFQKGWFREGRRWFEQLLEAHASGPSPSLAWVQWGAGFVSLYLGDLSGSDRHLRAALETAIETSVPEVQSAALCLLGNVAALTGKPEDGFRMLEEAVALGRLGDDEWVLAFALQTAGIVYATLGLPVLARPMLEEGVSTAHRSGVPAWPGTAELCWVLCVMGELDRAESLADESIEKLRRSGDRYTLLTLVLARAEVALFRGRFDVAAEAVAEASLLSDQQASIQRSSVATLRALLALSRGRPDEARSALEDAIEFAARVGLKAGGQMLALLAAIDLANGNVDEARIHADEAVQLARKIGHPLSLAESLRLRADVARTEGDLDYAESLLQQALPLAASNGGVLLTAVLLSDLGRVRVAKGEGAIGVRLAAAAKVFQDRVGLVDWRTGVDVDSLRSALDAEAFETAWTEGSRWTLEEATALATRGRGRRARPATGWDSLTPAEARVVTLAAEGLSNAEIAARLFVSPRTVSTHLRHVFDKLSVRSRAELAASAARRGAASD